MGRQLFQYHPTIGYQFIPGLKARVEHEAGGYLVRVNSAGFRSDREFQPTKPAGRFRVLLFGDSYTAGDGVSNKDRYSDQLERLLPGLEVYNFGLSGTGTDQQYLIYREFASRYEHDLVVISVLVENIRRVNAHYRPYADGSGNKVILAKPYFTLERGELALHHVPVPKEPVDPQNLPADEQEHVDRGGRFAGIRRAIGRFGPRFKERVQRWTRFQPLPAYNRADDPRWLLMRAVLEKWFSELTRPAIVVPLPLHQYVEQTASAVHYQARFRELSDPPRVIVHDPLVDFHRTPREERRAFRFEHDPHPTAAAHQVLAESLARTIGPMLERQAQPAAN